MRVGFGAQRMGVARRPASPAVTRSGHVAKPQAAPSEPKACGFAT
jgi:hypothetical protein